jgi:hypothetical protein
MISPDLSAELLSETITVYKGILPVVLTVPHDGNLTKVGSVTLDYLGGKLRDLAVSILATDVYESLSQIRQENITLVMQKVKRQFITPAIQEYFESQCISHIEELASHNTRVLHLDLHGFKGQPNFGEFDLILGTGHRTTVGNSTLDQVFGSFLQKKGYSVYIPTDQTREGELYSASHPRTLVQKVRQAAIENVVSIQVEISPSFRMSDRQEQGRRLTYDIAEFINEYLMSHD